MGDGCPRAAFAVSNPKGVSRQTGQTRCARSTAREIVSRRRADPGTPGSEKCGSGGEADRGKGSAVQILHQQPAIFPLKPNSVNLPARRTHFLRLLTAPGAADAGGSPSAAADRQPGNHAARCLLACLSCNGTFARARKGNRPSHNGMAIISMVAGHWSRPPQLRSSDSPGDPLDTVKHYAVRCLALFGRSLYSASKPERAQHRHRDRSTANASAPILSISRRTPP